MFTFEKYPFISFVPCSGERPGGHGKMKINWEDDGTAYIKEETSNQEEAMFLAVPSLFSVFLYSAPAQDCPQDMERN